EQGVRASFANEIIKERDPIFEHKLLEINNEIKQSQKVDSLVKLGDSDLLSACISNELLDMTGFYYACQAMICDPRDSILLTPTSEKYGCDEYYDKLIDSLGTRIGYTSFFYIKDFDGVVEYLGRFSFLHLGVVVACIFVSSRKIAMKGSGMLKFYRGRSVWRKRRVILILMQSTKVGYWWIPRGTLVIHVIWSVSGRSNTPGL
ncbi:MAG: hypothetical protein ACLUPL_09395, partial [Butyricimonas virosa]